MLKIFSYGEVPYAAFSNAEVVEFLSRGERLKKPYICPEAFWDIIMKCWEEKPTDRPAFKSLNSMIEQFIQGFDTSFNVVISAYATKNVIVDGYAQ